MPLNGKSLENGNAVFINPETFEAYPDQREFLLSIQRLTISELELLYGKLVGINSNSGHLRSSFTEPLKKLLDQWVERIQSFPGIPKKEIGQIATAKNHRIGKKITIAMIQSLVKLDDVKEFANSFGTIIIDECHHIPAKTFREAIINFNAYYLYGLPVTPIRKNNDEQLIFVYIGEILAQANPAVIKNEMESGH